MGGKVIVKRQKAKGRSRKQKAGGRRQPAKRAYVRSAHFLLPLTAHCPLLTACLDCFAWPIPPPLL